MPEFLPDFAVFCRWWSNRQSWREAHCIQCLKSTVEKIVIHEFRGDRSEFEFLKIIANYAKKLQALLLVLTTEKFASAEEVDRITHELGAIGGSKWAADKCLVLLLGPDVKNFWSFRRASDLSVREPFNWWTSSWLHIPWFMTISRAFILDSVAVSEYPTCSLYFVGVSFMVTVMNCCKHWSQQCYLVPWKDCINMSTFQTFCDGGLI